MRWLALSSDVSEPIPKIEFSFKKPLFAASVVLEFGSSSARADARARIPLKGDLHYSVDVAWRSKSKLFAFSKVTERDVLAGHGREIVSGETSYAIRPVGDQASRSVEKIVEVINESPAQLLAHLQALPAFQRAHSTDEPVYGGYIAIGARIEALRIERVGPAEDALAQTKYQFFAETYEVRTMRVPRMFAEKEWAALPWNTRGAYGFTYDVDKKTLTAASFNLPIIGRIEIKA